MKFQQNQDTSWSFQRILKDVEVFIEFWWTFIGVWCRRVCQEWKHHCS